MYDVQKTCFSAVVKYIINYWSVHVSFSPGSLFPSFLLKKHFRFRFILKYSPLWLPLSNIFGIDYSIDGWLSGELVLLPRTDGIESSTCDPREDERMDGYSIN